MLSKAEITQKLQDKLQAGWERFQGHEREKYQRYYDFLAAAGFYESEHDAHFPNPAYDAAAQNIGREFMHYAVLIADLSFVNNFPGAFLDSREATDGNIATRTFTLPVFQRGHHPFSTFGITFEHRHDTLDFVSVPKLSLVSK